MVPPGICARSTSRARAALQAAADYGPYFATAVDRTGDGWTPWNSLQAAAAMEEEVTRTASALGLPKPDRVAASTWHLGRAAQVTSPLLGAALHGGVPEVGPNDIWTRALAAGPRQVALRPSRLSDPTGDNLARVIEAVLTPPSAAVAAAYAVSATVLWGNIAASLTGAARVVAAVKPADAPAADALVADALAHGRLRGTIDDAGFRRSCCLIYKVPGGGCCGDCVLMRRGGGHGQGSGGRAAPTRAD